MRDPESTPGNPPWTSVNRARGSGRRGTAAHRWSIVCRKSGSISTREDVRFMRTLSRRHLLRLAVALPCAGLFSRYRALAAPYLNRVKITGIRAMAIRNIAGNSPLLAFPEWDGLHAHTWECGFRGQP